MGTNLSTSMTRDAPLACQRVAKRSETGYEDSKITTGVLTHLERDLRVVTHVDDFLVSGEICDVAWARGELAKKYESLGLPAKQIECLIFCVSMNPDDHQYSRALSAAVSRLRQNNVESAVTIDFAKLPAYPQLFPADEEAHAAAATEGVSIEHANLTDDQIPEVVAQIRSKIRAEALGQLVLTRVDLSHSLLEAQAVAVLGSILQCAKSLASLQLSSNRIGDAGAEEVRRLLLGHPSLVQVGLSSNHINLAGAGCLARALETSPVLEDLDLVRP